MTGAPTPDARRSFDRFVNFTDAVVAIAITLLVLPLVDISGPRDGQTVWQVLTDNSGLLIAFALAFALIAANWRIHNKVMNGLRSYDSVVFWLNIVWISLIALMPWTAAMFGASDAWNRSGEGFGGTGLLFYGVLALITFVLLTISLYVDRNPDLLEPQQTDEWRAGRKSGRFRAVAAGGSLLLIGIATLFIPQVANYLPIVVLPVALVIAQKLADRGVDDHSYKRSSS